MCKALQRYEEHSDLVETALSTLWSLSMDGAFSATSQTTVRCNWFGVFCVNVMDGPQIAFYIFTK